MHETASTKKKKMFKDSSQIVDQKGQKSTTSKQPEEGSVEYWNEQRAKLGLKPLKS